MIRGQDPRVRGTNPTLCQVPIQCWVNKGVGVLEKPPKFLYSTGNRTLAVSVVNQVSYLCTPVHP